MLRLSGFILLFAQLMFVFSINIYGQGIHFNQLEYSPLQLNPASSGLVDDVNIFLNYRKEHIDYDINFTTSSLTILFPVYKKDSTIILRKLGGVGISLMEDAVGEFNEFRKQFANVNFSYNIPIKPQIYISIGIQGAYQRNYLSPEQFTTGNQWIPNRGFDPGTSLGESIGKENVSMFEWGTGLQWNHDRNGKIYRYLGFSIFNKAQPQISTLENIYRKYVKKLHGGALLYSNDKYDLHSSFNYAFMQGYNFLFVKKSFRYYFKNHNPFDLISSGSADFSIGYRTLRSIVFGINVNQPFFSLGISYDIGLQKIEDNSIYGNNTEIGFALKIPIGRSADKKQPIHIESIKEVRQFFNEPVEKNMVYSREDQIDSVNYSDKDGEFLQFELNKDFNFGFNEYTLNEEAESYLDGIVTLLKDKPELSIQVIGHTDNVGSASINKRISLLRARAVADYLIKSTIDPRRIKASGKGDKEPLVPNNSEKNRAKNRRVDLLIYIKKFK